MIRRMDGKQLRLKHLTILSLKALHHVQSLRLMCLVNRWKRHLLVHHYLVLIASLWKKMLMVGNHFLIIALEIIKLLRSHWSP